MQGLAKTLFSQYEGRPDSDGFTKYPLLKNLLDEEAIDSVDLSLAFQLAPKGSPECIYLFLCYLSQAAKQGHLCVTIADTVTPSQLFPIDVESELKEAAACCQNLPIKREVNRFYFPKFYACEKKFLHHFQRLSSHAPILSISDPYLSDQNLLPEQIEAVRLACRNAISVISGGPGTGKTFTAGVLIQALWNAFSPDQKQKARFVLAAPTGKAAMNLQKSFQRICDTLEGFEPLRAQTLHSLLGIRPGQRQGRRIHEDVVIVDECSMIDVQLMAELFACVKSGARLIMLGDSHQLPPVEAGSLFTDMISLMDEVGELKHCIRVELQGIRELSEAIYCGDVEGTLSLLSGDISGVRRFPFSSKSVTRQLEEIVNYAADNRPVLKDHSFESIKTYLESFCLLTPLRQGLYGVDRLNQLIAERFRDSIAHPIMITRNDSRKGLFNGDTGVLIEGKTALFLSDEGVKKVPAVLLPQYEYAYCLSVHKSQGSEYDHVGLLMPPGAEVFGREVLYTGVTRARKQLDLWGSDDILCAAIEKKSCRHSGIRIEPI